MEQGEVAEDVVCLGYDLPDDKTFERFTRETFLANYYIEMKRILIKHYRTFEYHRAM